MFDRLLFKKSFLSLKLHKIAWKKVSILLILLLTFYLNSQSAAVENGDNDIKSFRIHSPYQSDSTTIRVLLPKKIKAHKRYQVLYILPVKEKDNSKFGDGLLEIKKYDYHNKYNLICVAPEFTFQSWYANHETKPDQQDESHFLKTVIPFVDSTFQTIQNAKGRLLLGFSKSGWGAFTLLLRHPDKFNKAAGWDIGIRIDAGPISENERTKKIERIFGSVSNFEKYRISSLLRQQGALLGDKARLFYYNSEGIRGLGGAEIHRLMVDLEIPHRYLFEPKRTHRWDSGWIPEAIRFLVEN